MAELHKELLEQTNKRIEEIEEAIIQIGRTRNQLKRNSNEVKGQIQTSISRQLERLRSRELWLLSQVDILENAKESVLQQQEEQLNRALGSLHGSLQMYLKKQSSNPAELDSIERFQYLSLEPQEVPNLSFRVNTSDLTEAIHQFGRLEASGFPFESSAFVDPTSPSSCLPKTFEDYEDDEHHILYKTVSAINYQNNPNQCINVQIPRLSHPVAKWLLQTPNQADVEETNSFKQQPIKSAFYEHFSKSLSTQQWLVDIHQHPETEEEVFEMINQSESDFVVLKEDSMQEPEFEQFRSIWRSPMNDWLIKECVNTINNYCLDEWKDVLSYFTTLTKDHEIWLLKSSEDSISCCQKNSPCFQSSESMDIENLDELLCVDSPTHTKREEINEWLNSAEETCDEQIEEQVCNPFSDWQNTHGSMWLQKEVHNHMNEKDIDEMERSIVKQVCLANEACEKFSDCVCDGKCGDILKSRKNNSCCQSRLNNTSSDETTKSTKVFSNANDRNVEDWLLSSTSNTFNSACSNHQNLFTDSYATQEWVVSQSGNVENDNKFLFSPLSAYLENTSKVPSDWLLTKSGNVFEFTKQNSSYDVWVKSEKSEVASEEKNLGIKFTHGNITDWLCSKDSTESPMVVDEIQHEKLGIEKADSSSTKAPFIHKIENSAWLLKEKCSSENNCVDNIKFAKFKDVCMDDSVWLCK